MDILLGHTTTDVAVAIAILFSFTAFGYLFRKYVIFRLEEVSKKSKNLFDDGFVIVIKTFSVYFYFFIGLLVTLKSVLALPDVIDAILLYVLIVTIAFYVLKAMFKVVDYALKVYESTLPKDRRGLATVLPALGLLAKVSIFAFLLIFLLSNLGIDVTALVAGLGIGGLAIAFAFQKILADVFSTFVIFFDKPFSKGDLISVGSQSGVVEHVGLKTSRLRALTGEVIIIPNQDMVNAVVGNISSRSKRKITIIIPIEYDIDEKKLSTVSDICENLVLAQEKSEFSHAHIREFGEHAVLFELVYYLEGVSYDAHVRIRHSIHVDLLSALKKEGIELGYPIDFEKRMRK